MKIRKSSKFYLSVCKLILNSFFVVLFEIVSAIKVFNLSEYTSMDFVFYFTKWSGGNPLKFFNTVKPVEIFK